MTAAKCPICGKPPVPEHQPFCSGRCADIDLHRWLSGHYALPGPEDPESLGDAEDED